MLNWNEYRLMLKTNVTITQHNLDYAKRKYEEAITEHQKAQMGLQEFEKNLDEYLQGLDK